jgi:hypothetical protein
MMVFIVGWKLYRTMIGNWQNQQVCHNFPVRVLRTSITRPWSAPKFTLVTGDPLMD